MENIHGVRAQFCPPNKAAKAVGRIKRAVQTGWEIRMESRSPSSAKISSYCFRVRTRKKGWRRMWRAAGGV